MNDPAVVGWLEAEFAAAAGLRGTEARQHDYARRLGWSNREPKAQLPLRDGEPERVTVPPVSQLWRAWLGGGTGP